jgi:hypothetical protein
MHSGYEGLGFVGFLISIAILIIGLCITIAPLIIWRNGNRTNRLLALIALQENIPHEVIRNVYNCGGSKLPSELMYKTNISNHKIKKNENRQEYKEFANKTEKGSAKTENSRSIDEDLQAIKNKFPGFEWIEPSPYEGYALIKHDGKFNIIKIGGYETEIVSPDMINKMPKIKEWMNDFLYK